MSTSTEVINPEVDRLKAKIKQKKEKYRRKNKD
jgi:hypothetical protein